MTLKISQAHIDAILEQSRVEYPDEACGVILGPLGKDHALRLKPMINAAHSPTFYEFDPKDLLSLYREVDDNDEDKVTALRVGVEADCNVFAPPAVVEPDFEPDEKLISLVVNALTFMVFPPVGDAAMSVVIKIYPVEPELMA